jgi:hypothetical protein
LTTDPDEYLPKETLQWCQKALQSLGFSVHLPSETAQLDTVTETQHFQAYIQLRTLIKQHEALQLIPALSLTLSPVGAYAWILDQQIQDAHNRAGSVDESDNVELLTYVEEHEFSQNLGFQGGFRQPDANNDIDN